MNPRIVIVGAGPIGCYLAQLLKKQGAKPLIIEEHNEVGRPVHCTGLIGHKVFAEKRPFRLSSRAITNIINGAVIHYDRQYFSIHRERVAYVIDRERFDKELSQGLDILYQNRFLGLEKSKSGYIVETNQDEISADIVVGADGANSTLRKILNRDANGISHYQGIQMRINTKPRYKDLVELYLKAPSFFWVVPEAQDIVRVGTISENPHKDLVGFLKETKIKGEILERFGGVVAVGICPHTVRENIALVGDAACQMKPLSYGGIYFGLKAASILASCIKERRLQEYDSRWKRELVSEIKIGLKARQFYRRLDKDELSKIFWILKTQKSLIEKIGDFENHSRLLLEIIKKPRLYPQIGTLLPMFFKKISD